MHVDESTVLLTHSFTHASFRTTNSVSSEPPDAAAQLRGEQCQQPQRQQPARHFKMRGSGQYRDDENREREVRRRTSGKRPPMESPRAFLESLGTDGVRHTSHLQEDGTMSDGSFLEHLTGVEEDLAAWSCAPEVCLAGLFHSIYGTESFQAFSLPLDPDGANRERVRELIGSRAEYLAFINCTMERNSLDEAIMAYRAADPSGRTGLLHADVTGPREHVIRTRTGQPGDAVTHDPQTGGRLSSIPAQFVLSEQELLDLVALHLCDWLQQVIASNAEHTEERKMAYSQHGKPGYWLIPPHGYAGIRQEAFRTMAEVLGGAAMAGYEQKQRQIDTGAGPVAHWVEGEMSTADAEAWDGRGTTASQLPARQSDRAAAAAVSVSAAAVAAGDGGGAKL